MEAEAADECEKVGVAIVGADGEAYKGELLCYTSLTEAPFSPSLLQELRRAGFTEPTPIQSYTWPLAQQGSDIIGLAKTGSGKTLAFLLPAFDSIVSEGTRYRDVRLLVLAPTRELANQIEEQAEKFGKANGIRSCCVYGGVPRGPQLKNLRQTNPHCVVACPGRLNDLLSWNQIDIGYVKHLVVDEADQLLDMGFEPQVREILKYLPNTRQTLFFSATWPEGVQKLADDILRPERLEIRIDAKANELRANECVSQQVIILPDVAAKEEELLRVIRSQQTEPPPQSRLWGLLGRSAEATCKILIFCTSRQSVDSVHGFLANEKVRCAATHAEHDQATRERTLRDFRNGEITILIATDLAARGLDISGIEVVINFEPPHSYKVEDYVHRIGRTGRAGRLGRALTFLLPTELNQAKAIVEVMRRTGQPVSQALEDLASRATGSSKDRKAAKRAEYLKSKGKGKGKEGSDFGVSAPDDGQRGGYHGGSASYSGNGSAQSADYPFAQQEICRPPPGLTL